MDVRETLDAFADLGARTMIPQQWGTFELADDPASYPVLELRRQIALRQLDPARFVILDLGELHPLQRTASD